MGSPFAGLLTARSWLLADGAIGTGLMAAGLPSGRAPEPWNAERPELVSRLHRAFLSAATCALIRMTDQGWR